MKVCHSCFICPCMRACARAHLSQPWVSSLRSAVHLGFWDRFSHWDLGLTASLGALGSTCLWFPSAGIKSTCQQAWLFTWVLGIELNPHACVVSTLPVELFPSLWVIILYIFCLRWITDIIYHEIMIKFKAEMQLFLYTYWLALL